MRERPPPMIERGQRIETEFVIPIDGFCMKFGLSHVWEREDDRVKVCKFCEAEWWDGPVEELTKEGEAA